MSTYQVLYESFAYPIKYIPTNETYSTFGTFMALKLWLMPRENFSRVLALWVSSKGEGSLTLKWEFVSSALCRTRPVSLRRLTSLNKACNSRVKSLRLWLSSRTCPEDLHTFWKRGMGWVSSVYELTTSSSSPTALWMLAICSSRWSYQSFISLAMLASYKASSSNTNYHECILHHTARVVLA